VDDGLQITCAVAPLTNVSHDVILANEIVSDLQCLPSVNLSSYVVRDVDDITAQTNEYVVSNSTADGCVTEAVDDDDDDDDDRQVHDFARVWAILRYGLRTSLSRAYA